MAMSGQGFYSICVGWRRNNYSFFVRLKVLSSSLMICNPNALNTSICNTKQASLLVKDGALPIVSKAQPFPHYFAD